MVRLRLRTSLVTSFAIALTLLALGAASWTAITAIRDAHSSSEQIRATVIAYTDLQRAVSAEAFAEAGYRRAPSPEARARLEEAIRGVDEAIAVTRERTGREDGPILSQLQLLNKRYVDQVRATLDTPLPKGDDRVAGPALDSIELLLDSAVDGHRSDFSKASAVESEVIDRLTWLLPTVFALAFGILGLAWSKMLQEQRRLAQDARASRKLATARADLLLEEQRQMAQLKDLQRARNDLVAMVQHDLGNPISVIGGYAELLAESPALGEQSRRQIQVIAERAAHMTRLVDDLSDLDSLKSVHSLRDTRPLDLADLASAALDTHAGAAATKDVALERELQPVIVHGDPARLRQVLDNLIGNAVKYTPAGGRVRVEVAHELDRARFTVSDTGIGIPEDQLPRVFEKFFRATTATDAELPGTGLGLAITKTIVEAHDGVLTVAAHRPRGTTFEVVLPADPAEPAGGSAAVGTAGEQVGGSWADPGDAPRS